MMALINEFYRKGSVTKKEYQTLLVLLNPVAPHMTEELWESYGEGKRLYQQTWPGYEEDKTVESTVEIAVQVNGKVKATIAVGLEEAQETVKEKVMAQVSVQAAIGEKKVVKEIYVKGRIYNIVIK